MPLVPLRTLLDHAAANDYGVAAFNVNNMEQIQAIMEAAQETESPVIVQASRGARAYSQDASAISCWRRLNSILKSPSSCIRITVTACRPAKAPSRTDSPP